MKGPRFVVMHIGWSLEKPTAQAKTSQRACLPQRTGRINNETPTKAHT